MDPHNPYLRRLAVAAPDLRERLVELEREKGIDATIFALVREGYAPNRLAELMGSSRGWVAYCCARWEPFHDEANPTLHDTVEAEARHDYDPDWIPGTPEPDRD